MCIWGLQLLEGGLWEAQRFQCPARGGAGAFQGPSPDPIHKFSVDVSGLKYTSLFYFCKITKASYDFLLSKLLKFIQSCYSLKNQPIPIVY